MDASSLSPAQLEKYPAMAPPPGYISHFGNPIADGSLGPVTIIVSCVLAGLALTTVCLRMYARAFVTKNLGWDDYVSLLAMVGALGWTGLVCHGFSHGLGVHQWDLTAYHLLQLVPELNAFDYLYPWVMLFAKLSICFLFYRLFSPNRVVRLLIYLAVILCIIIYVASFFLGIFICIPDRPQFLNCSYKLNPLNITLSAINLALDVYLLTLPLFAISRLHMKIRRKFAVAGAFLTGLMACLSSILGLYYRVQGTKFQDVTWHFSPIVILAAFEVDACIVVGCMPILPSLGQQKTFFGISTNSLRSLRSRLLRSRKESHVDKSAHGTIQATQPAKSGSESQTILAPAASNPRVVPAVPAVPEISARKPQIEDYMNPWDKSDVELGESQEARLAKQ